MNSISLDYSFRVKVGETFLNLFIGSNRVMVCSDTSLIRSDVYVFVQDSAILFQWSVAALFQYTFVETFTAKFGFIRGDVIAAVSYYTDITSPYWKGSLLSWWLCITQHVRGKIFATASAVKLSTQSIARYLCHSALNSGLIQSSSSSSARARYSESVSISNSSNMFTSQNLVKKL